MIVYAASKAKFCDDVVRGLIDQKISSLMRVKSGRSVGPSELRSWRNSLLYMQAVLQDPEIPDESGVAVEYHIPNSAKRVDLIISGQQEDKRESVVIIELKQWDSATATEKPSVVSTVLNGGSREVPHPSYQAWSYARLLQDFNETIEAESIGVQPCAYLHNFEAKGILDDARYREDIERAPLFLKHDAERLRAFIKKWVRFGDSQNVLYRIDQGRIRPSKSLADHLGSLLKGNQEFTLIDEQMVVFQTGRVLARSSSRERKNVMIVEGGPGTGKSVVAINLLVEIIQQGMTCQYVTKNSAPRAVFEAKLVGHLRKSQVSNLFVGSGSFTESNQGEFDVLIVDEAHRLNERSGIFSNLGENQVRELIRASNCTIFFIDEDQRIALKDIGRKDEIRKWANECGAEIHEYELASQFRCNGSDGYVAWVDSVLQLRETAHATLEGVEYDFEVFDDPKAMHDEIRALNAKNGRSRIVAGYCWDWKSKGKSGGEVYDIEMPEHGFRVRWNLAKDGGLWIMTADSIDEAGCIHTCQGLELDYVGVIIGPDLIVRNGQVITRSKSRSSMDQSLKGLKKLAQEDPVRAESIASSIIKNTYRTLMTRGLKGCYVYSTDQETREYVRAEIGSTTRATDILQAASPTAGYTSRRRRLPGVADDSN